MSESFDGVTAVADPESELDPWVESEEHPPKKHPPKKRAAATKVSR
jgi:hypothetical protein